MKKSKPKNKPAITRISAGCCNNKFKSENWKNSKTLESLIV